MAVPVTALASYTEPLTNLERVTFLFTDVEGSTRILREHERAYTQVIADYRRLVRETVEQAGGREIDCRGDEVFAAFGEPSAALEAALGAQRAVAGHPWEDGIELRVRIGIHAGRAALEDGDYVGLDVHRAARISQAGHGGQVLVSEPTRAELSGVELKDLGEYALHGLDEPERLFQVVAPGLAGTSRRSGSSRRPPGRCASCSPTTRCCCARGSRGCSRTAASTSSGRPATADELMLKVRSYRPGRGDRRHPDAADVHRRGAASRAGDPRRGRRPTRRPRPVAPRRARLRPRPARRRDRRRRLPAQGPPRRRRGLHRCRPAGRRGRVGRRSRGRQPARQAAGEARSARTS